MQHQHIALHEGHVFVAHPPMGCVRVLQRDGQLVRYLWELGDTGKELSQPSRIAIAPETNEVSASSLSVHFTSHQPCAYSSCLWPRGCTASLLSSPSMALSCGASGKGDLHLDSSRTLLVSVTIGLGPTESCTCAMRIIIACRCWIREQGPAFDCGSVADSRQTPFSCLRRQAR